MVIVSSSSEIEDVHETVTKTWCTSKRQAAVGCENIFFAYVCCSAVCDYKRSCTTRSFSAPTNVMQETSDCRIA